MKRFIPAKQSNTVGWLKSLWVFVVLCSVPLQALATHIIGGEIYYRYVGNNQYEITLDVYRDCFYGQAGFDDPAHIAIFYAGGDSVIQLNLNPISIDTLDPTMGDPCFQVPDDVCVDWARYRTVVTLPFRAGGYDIVYQRCCRNHTIANLVRPDTTGATYSIHISEKGLTEHNSSPRFNFLPPAFTCINKPIEFQHSAIDEDGDSLVYRLCRPLHGASIDRPQPNTPEPPPFDSVIWQPGYSVNNLLAPAPDPDPLTINPQTGLLTGFPHLQGQFVVGVCVEEYRDGELLSVLRRDFQYNVGPCKEVEALAIIPEAQCDNLTVNFTNTSTLAESFLWYPEWPNMGVVSTATNLTHTYPDTGTYTVVLIAEPNSSCADTLFEEIFLQFNSLEADMLVQTQECDGSALLILQDQSVDPVSPVVSWEWVVTHQAGADTSFEQNPVFVVPNPSSGTVVLTATTQNGCVDSKTLLYTAGGNNPADQIDLNVEVCLGDSIALNPNADPAAGYTYQWEPATAFPDPTTPNPVVAPTTDASYSVTISGFNNLCQSVREINVAVKPLPELDFRDSSACDGLTVHFENLSQNADAFLWNFGDPQNPGAFSAQTSPTYTYPSIGTYTVTLQTGPSELCQDTLQREITLVEKELQADFDYEYLDCSEEEVVIQFYDASVNSLNNTASWHWTFSNGQSSNEPNPVVTITHTQTLLVTLSIETEEGCGSTKAEALFIELIQYDYPDSVLLCHNEALMLNPNGNPSYQYLWSPSTFLNDPTLPNPTVTNPTEPTLYTVQITNVSADTCTIEKQVLVYVPPAIDLATSDDVLTCDAEVTLTASTQVPADLVWYDEAPSAIGSGPTLTVPVSGSNVYTVVATDAFDCEERESVVVAGGPVDIEAFGDGDACTDENIQVWVENHDPNDQLTYQWEPEELFLGPTNVPNPMLKREPGTHTLTVTATSQYGCSTTDTVQVNLVDSDISLDFDHQVACSGFTVQFFNQSQNAFNYVWNFGDPTTDDDISYEVNPTYTYSDTGTYEVLLTVDFDAACVDTIRKTVVIDEPLFIPDFDFEYETCTSDSIVIQFYDTSINFLNNTSSWNWVFDTLGTAQEPNPVLVVYDNVDLEVTLAIGTPNGCVDSVTRTLKIEFIEWDFPDSVRLCRGDTVQLNPDGIPYQVVWTPGDHLSDPNVFNPFASPPQTTTYTAQITHITSDTCTIEQRVKVFVPEEIELSATADTTSCGSPILLEAAANVPVDLKWFELPGGLPVGTGSPIPVDPDSVGLFVVVATDVYDCSAFDTVRVKNESLAVELAEQLEACPDDTIQLEVTNHILDHQLNYSWTTTPPGQILAGGDTPTPTVLTAPAGGSAVYSVQVGNQFGCSQQLEVTVQSFDFVPTVLPRDTACYGVPTELNAGADPTMTYSWSPDSVLVGAGTPNPTATLTQTTVFTVQVSQEIQGQECSAERTMEVFVPEKIEIEAVSDTLTCGEPITLSASTNVPVNLLAWFDEQMNNIGIGPAIAVDPELEATYFVVAEDAFGCRGLDSIHVLNQQIDVEIEGQGFIAVCPRDFIQVCVSNLDPNDTLSYQWTVLSGAGVILGGDTTACPLVSTEPGTTVLQVTATNQFGCDATTTLEILTYEFNASILDTVRVCKNVPTPINPIANNLLNYHWTPEELFVDPNVPNPIIITDVDTTVFATIMGFQGGDTCMAIQEVRILVNPDIELEALASDTVQCALGEVTLSAEGAVQLDSVVWSTDPTFGTVLGTTPTLTVTPPMGSNDYYLLAFDDLGCRDSAQVRVETFPLQISLADETIFCREAGSVTLEVQNNDPNQVLSYFWYPEEFILGSNTVNPVTVAPDGNTVFFVDVRNQFGCETTDSARVLFFDLAAEVDITIVGDTVLIFGAGESSQLVATFDPTYTYDWFPPEGLDDPTVFDPFASPDETTTYTVKVTNAFGCMATDTATIRVINPECEEPFVFVPNTFTPNGDGVNDVLRVRGEHIDELEFAVFSRWGQLIFLTNDPNSGWDGTFRGEPVPPETYGFYVKAKCFNGFEFFKKGSVRLVR